MAKTEKSVLEFTADGFIENPELYGQIYKRFITTNLDKDGNVIDDAEQKNIVSVLRDRLEKMNRLGFAVLIEKLVEYENFGVNEKLMNFIDMTKRFVIAVEIEPNKLSEYYPHWDKACDIDIYKGGLTNLIMAMIVEYVEYYLDELMDRIKL